MNTTNGTTINPIETHPVSNEHASGEHPALVSIINDYEYYFKNKTYTEAEIQSAKVNKSTIIEL